MGRLVGAQVLVDSDSTSSVGPPPDMVELLAAPSSGADMCVEGPCYPPLGLKHQCTSY